MIKKFRSSAFDLYIDSLYVVMSSFSEVILKPEGALFDPVSNIIFITPSNAFPLICIPVALQLDDISRNDAQEQPCDVSSVTEPTDRSYIKRHRPLPSVAIGLASEYCAQETLFSFSMKVTLIMILMAVVGLSSAYSLGDVYEKPQLVERVMSGMSVSNFLESKEKSDISGGSGSMSVESVEKRDISGGSGSMSVERIEKRDISGGSGSMSVERIEKRDISGGSGSMSVERIEKRDISGGSGSMSVERIEKRDISGGSGSMSVERIEKRDISGGSGSMSVERIEKRDISGGSGSMSVERIEKRDISGGSSSLESRERRDAFAVSHDLDLRRLRRSASSDSGSYSIEG
ncbi:uncharacterized protein LOC119589379 [Penaeus monodon]|uniref:uncharacterized protein LOC119589379 n=1 Tax=Penaeus monodon TaxID=6687 RepID=UPI0018A77B55|nr:uncharacterized protein LOC119589379 [Penaeus monodon]